MRNAFSVRLLLIALAVAAMILALYRSAGASPWAVAILVTIEPIGLTLALFGLFFLIAFPLGLIEKYMISRSDPGQSPFATDRLPTQIVTPTDREST